MLRLHLNQDLNTIISEGNLRDATFELIRDAEARGWLEKLIEVVRNNNTNNPKIDAFAKTFEQHYQTKRNYHKTSDRPYKGLAPFLREDKDYFFGREKFVKELVETIEESPLTTLVGNSGVGKSSVVFAGLAPKLEEDNWIIIDFKPRTKPISAVSYFLD